MCERYTFIQTLCGGVEVLFALVGGSAPKPSPCWELGLRRRPVALFGQTSGARELTFRAETGCFQIFLHVVSRFWQLEFDGQTDR